MNKNLASQSSNNRTGLRVHVYRPHRKKRVYALPASIQGGDSFVRLKGRLQLICSKTRYVCGDFFWSKLPKELGLVISASTYVSYKKCLDEIALDVVVNGYDAMRFGEKLNRVMVAIRNDKDIPIQDLRRLDHDAIALAEVECMVRLENKGIEVKELNNQGVSSPHLTGPKAR